MKTLRIGLVGAGYMGSLHAEKLETMRRAGAELHLAGVCDIEPRRACELSERHGVPVHDDLRSLLSCVDAVIVAVPTVAHFDVVRSALEANVDVLVEKPIAATLEEAEALLVLAGSRGLVLQVGHLEWFNSAMQVIREHIREPRFIEAHRMGPFPDRATDMDVVRDLMIHDLDILQQLLGEEPDQIDAVGVPVLTANIDIANARISYPSGCVANLTASRVSPTPMRKIRFFQPNGYFSVDFLQQSAVAARRPGAANGERPSIEIEKLNVGRGDALTGQLQAFVRVLRTRETPQVDGLGGIGALRTALRVNAAISPPEPETPRRASARRQPDAASGRSAPFYR